MVASLGVETVEKVLLYHVVPGGPIDSGNSALGADGAHLATADGGNTFKVNVCTSQRPKGSFGIKLVDKDLDLRNPWVVKTPAGHQRRQQASPRARDQQGSDPGRPR